MKKIIFFCSLVWLVGCKNTSQQEVTIAHNGSPLLSFLYFLEDQNESHFSSVKLGSGSDVGYALISGSVDAGFVEPDKVTLLQSLKGFEKLEVLGKVSFPFGASLVIPKGSNIKLHELEGKVVAVLADKPSLLVQLLDDLNRFQINTERIRFVPLSFDAMLPALESGAVDAALLKGAHTAIALQAEHLVLYQKWDMAPGNGCCPPVVDQLELVFLGQKSKRESLLQLVEGFVTASGVSADKLRAVTAKALHLNPSLLAQVPVSEFAPANDSIVSLYFQHQGDAHLTSLHNLLRDATPAPTCNHTPDEHTSGVPCHLKH